MKQDYKQLWKALARDKNNTTRDKITYCILRAIAAKSDEKVAITKHFIRRAFPAVTSPIKIANGRRPFDCMQYNVPHLGYTKVWGLTTKTYSEQPTMLLGVAYDKLLDDEEQILFRNIADQINPRNLIRHYSYFFTRQDLFKEYQLVQTAHVALQLGTELNQQQVKDLHFTCCGVEDLDELENVENVLKTINAKYTVFREPDIGNQKTAIGVHPIAEHKRGLLRNYKLLRFPKPELVGNEVC